MPQISVSDTLYRQLEEATDDCDTEDAMWEMVYLYNRGNNPSE
ncbi:phosphohydrolase [Halobacteriales archaeon QS_4_62_28]|nr:MAG: phosphohydrolase [Halobacteriales archaeon QS_4_62_28]